MKKIVVWSLLLALFLTAFAGCGGGEERVEDTRELTPFQYTTLNLSSTDREGRTVRSGDAEIEGSYVGLFYHIWHGYHTNGYPEIYDITKLLAEDEEAFWDMNNTRGKERYHYWGEPLYGYYCSDDPWVITRHIELLTMAGVDYLVYDTTNTVVYTQAIEAIFQKLSYFQDQGWDVPKVAFYTNTNSMSTIKRIYETWYAQGKYQDLWFSFGEKPLIIGVLGQDEGMVMSPDEVAALNEEYQEFFDFRISTWPNLNLVKDYEWGFPWMDWEYPQSYFNGTMSVSLAQHPGSRMSEGAMSNNGRGFNYDTFRNDSSLTELGANYAGQWQTVFDWNAANPKRPVNNVFLTGWNEWIAIKKNDGLTYFFVDTFNEEYSRDIEMMAGGYEDNYYLQTVDNIRAFKYEPAKHYLTDQVTVDLEDQNFADWTGAAHFKDFEGDTLDRNFRDAINKDPYVDTSGRNDITDVMVTHDGQNLYIKVTAAEEITDPEGENWMNVLIKTDEDLANSFAGYKYIVNRHPDGTVTSVERSTGGYEWETAGTAQLRVYGDTMLLAIPLEALGLTADNCFVQLKVADNVQNPDDIMDYYVTGDSAPIGRLSYTYGY